MAYQEPGSIMTETEAARYLQNQSRYKNDYQNIENQLSANLGVIENEYFTGQQNLLSNYGQDRFSVGTDFSQTMANAFQSAEASRANLLESNVGQGFREQGFSDLERMTTAAYDSYIRNYAANRKNLDEQYVQSQSNLENTMLSNLQSTTETATKAVSEIDEILANEASNYAALYNGPRQYLQYLADNGIIKPDNPNFSKFFNVTYESGSPMYNLKSNEELDALFYNYDEKGNIVGFSKPGEDFYKQMLYGTNDLGTTFEAWLYGTNPKLYNWAYSGTNFNDVFEQAGLSNVIKEGRYSGDTVETSNTYNRGTTYTDSKDFGTVVQYQSDEGQTINYMEGLKFEGMNEGDIASGETERFTATYTDSNGIKRKYKMKVSKNGELADDNVINDISKSIGGKFENEKIYTYGQKAYISIIDDSGNVTLKEVEITDESDAFWNTLKNTKELSKH